MIDWTLVWSFVVGTFIATILRNIIIKILISLQRKQNSIPVVESKKTIKQESYVG